MAKRGPPGRVFFLPLAMGLTALLLTSLASAHPEDEVCDPGQPPTPFCLALMGQLVVTDPPSLVDTMTEYAALGVVHIIPRGTDHVLFVLALLLAAPGLRALLLQVTTFTVAHSVTLALAVLGIAGGGGAMVERLIAASIVFVAVENLLLRGRPLRVWRYALVFAFGLLHGLGFAGVLLERGLPADRLTAALVAFNLGVEAGQLLVVLVAGLVGWVGLRRWLGSSRYFQWVAAPASVAIAATGIFWLFERW